jgi:hypothetical protein
VTLKQYIAKCNRWPLLWLCGELLMFIALEVLRFERPRLSASIDVARGLVFILVIVTALVTRHLQERVLCPKCHQRLGEIVVNLYVTNQGRQLHTTRRIEAAKKRIEDLGGCSACGLRLDDKVA